MGQNKRGKVVWCFSTTTTKCWTLTQEAELHILLPTKSQWKQLFSEVTIMTTTIAICQERVVCQQQLYPKYRTQKIKNKRKSLFITLTKSKKSRSGANSLTTRNLLKKNILENICAGWSWDRDIRTLGRTWQQQRETDTTYT